MEESTACRDHGAKRSRRNLAKCPTNQKIAFSNDSINYVLYER